jgi:NAD(P)-dependent dehydrogenase (short-subunit alcohol dehydrogenase family)
MRRLEGKVALITGAASGIGYAVARRFLTEGARVVCFDRKSTRLEDAFGRSHWLSVEGDVSNVNDSERAVARTLEHYGKLDVLVANAGLYDNRREFRSFTTDQLVAGFDELFDVNVKGYMLSALTALDALTSSRGCIIFTSSISGAHAGFGGALYVAAKHAVNGLTRQLALELAPEVRVNAVAPGYVPTGLSGLRSLGQGRSTGAPAAADQPLHAIADPDEYAAAFVFLASDETARTATGTILSLDGGSSIRGPRRRAPTPPASNPD